MEKLFDFLKSISDRPVVDLVILLVTLYFCGVFACSCSSLTPMISSNKLGAEGVVQKEKNVNRQIKWYFTPDGKTSEDY